VRQEVVRVSAVEHQYGWLLVPFDFGEEFAQLDAEFCKWQRSGGEECQPQDLNRSAFVAWIDCRL